MMGWGVKRVGMRVRSVRVGEECMIVVFRVVKSLKAIDHGTVIMYTYRGYIPRGPFFLELE